MCATTLHRIASSSPSAAWRLENFFGNLDDLGELAHLDVAVERGEEVLDRERLHDAVDREVVVSQRWRRRI